MFILMKLCGEWENRGLVTMDVLFVPMKGSPNVLGIPIINKTGKWVGLPIFIRKVVRPRHTKHLVACPINYRKT